MAQKKESFFWTSYSDLMTSLFFVMLVLFILVIVVLHKRMEATQAQLDEVKKVAASTKELSGSDYFEFKPEYKKYQLTIQVRYPAGISDIQEMISSDKEKKLAQLADAGRVIEEFLERHKDTQYLLIIEGQASKDNYPFNYQLSYERALGLIRYWIQDSHISFGKNCEILISGSGDGKLDTHSMRETGNETANQRFLIHILPKNIFDDSKKKD